MARACFQLRRKEGLGSFLLWVVFGVGGFFAGFMVACSSRIIKNRTVNSSSALFRASNSLGSIHSSTSSCSETHMLWFVTPA